MNDYRIRDDLCPGRLHARRNGEPRQIPIIQSTTFKYDIRRGHGPSLFDLEGRGLLLLPPPEPHLRHRRG